MITLKPYGGLANRMRAIDSVISITKGNHNPFRVFWECNKALNCDFKDLFFVPKGIELITQKHILPDIAVRILKRIRKILRQTKIYLPLGYDKYIFEEELKVLLHSNYDFKELNSIQKVYIESQERFFENDLAFNSFRPITFIQEKITQSITRFGENTIGIHIRRGDNVKSINESPLKCFIDLMQDEVEKDSEVMFFLATDSIDTENILKEQFRGKIISNKKSLDRNSTEGIQDALIDMMCLSKTLKILGSYWSSFSETAASLGNIELIVVRKK